MMKMNSRLPVVQVNTMVRVVMENVIRYILYSYLRKESLRHEKMKM